MFASNLIRALLLVMLLNSASAWAERVSMTQDAQLREEPRLNAMTIATVKKGAAGEAIGKQGPWFHVKLAGKTGWVLTTQVTFTPARNRQIDSSWLVGPFTSLGVRGPQFTLKHQGLTTFALTSFANRAVFFLVWIEL